MSTITWPTAQWAKPATCDLQVIDNLQRVSESPLSGYTQTLAMPGARWGWSMQFPSQNRADRDQLEGLLLSLDGRANRVRLWDFKRPQPRGLIGLSGVTLAAAAAQFATSLVLQGCRGANLLLGGSFETDGDANGVGDGWLRYSNGSTGALTQSLGSGFSPHAALSQACNASALGTTSADRQGVEQTVPALAIAGGAFTLSARCLASAGTTLRAMVVWRDAAATTISSPLQDAAATGADQTITLAGTCPANAVTGQIYLYQHTGTGAAAFAYFDAAYLVAGGAVSYPAPATLLCGDWMGLPSQLVRVVEDASANDAGRMTVQVRHMLRTAAASGGTVTLDRPTALYMRTESGLLMPRRPGNAEPELACDFVEAFA